MSVLYVYAICREAVIPDSEAVDRSRHFGGVAAGDIAAVYTPVSEEEFSQDVIDRRAGDLEWLGAIGYRHQGVVADLMKRTAIVPLRAFTMFSSETTLHDYLMANHDLLSPLLDKLDGKQEWTLRVEFDPERWSESLVRRVDSLWKLVSEIEAATTGKAFLLRKKLDDEKKRASREAEQQVVSEIEQAVCGKLSCETVAENRQQREGAFPQINLLLNRDEESQLQELVDELSSRYVQEGVTIGVTGPWPPYTFAR